MGLFYSDDLMSPMSKANLETMARVVDNTYNDRQSGVKALNAQITILTKYVSDLKECERSYFRQKTILQKEMSSYELIGNDGLTTLNPYLTRPDWDASKSGQAVLSIQNLEPFKDYDFIEKADPGRAQGMSPEASHAVLEMRAKLAEIDSALLRYHHLIKNAILSIDRKRLKLRWLSKEQGDHSAG